MALDDLQSLLIHNLQDMYSAEEQALEAMPKVAEAISNKKLRAIVDKHLKETHKQKDRVAKAIESLGETPGGETCKAMAGLVKEMNSFLKEKAEPEVLDAGIVVLLQKIEHYEIAGYGSCATFAEILGKRKAYDLICDILDEEESADKKLTRAAKAHLNEAARDQSDGTVH